MGGWYILMCMESELTTVDAFWHCLTLAVYYQLESVLEIGFVPAKKVG